MPHAVADAAAGTGCQSSIHSPYPAMSARRVAQHIYRQQRAVVAHRRDLTTEHTSATPAHANTHVPNCRCCCYSRAERERGSAHTPILRAASRGVVQRILYNGSAHANRCAAISIHTTIIITRITHPIMSSRHAFTACCARVRTYRAVYGTCSSNCFVYTAGNLRKRNSRTHV